MNNKPFFKLKWPSAIHKNTFSVYCSNLNCDKSLTMRRYQSHSTPCKINKKAVKTQGATAAVQQQQQQQQTQR